MTELSYANGNKTIPIKFLIYAIHLLLWCSTLHLSKGKKSHIYMYLDRFLGERDRERDRERERDLDRDLERDLLLLL